MNETACACVERKLVYSSGKEGESATVARALPI